MAKKTKKVKKVAYFDVNMRVSTMAKMPQNEAYWVAPGVQTKVSIKKLGLTSYLWEDHLGFKMPEVITIKLDYPFDDVYVENVKLENHGAASIGDILWHGAQAYIRAYKVAKGYWHGMGDLVFEGMSISEDGIVEFEVGS